MISLILNTCCLGPKADTTLSSGRRPYAERAYVLRNWLLPLYCANPNLDEVIVVGEFEPGEGYRYVESPSRYFNCCDALHQRQVGFEASAGDILIFQHDDHWFQFQRKMLYGMAADVLSPARWTRLRGIPERLNNGKTDGYISGHCVVSRREVIERCPWNDVPAIHTWDKAMTYLIQQAGFQIAWSDTVKCWDCEMYAEPWK